MEKMRFRSPAGTVIEFDVESLIQSVSAAVDAANITDDAGWSAFVANRCNVTAINAAGTAANAAGTLNALKAAVVSLAGETAKVAQALKVFLDKAITISTPPAP